MEYLDNNSNIDISILQLAINKVSTDHNTENEQTDQLAIFNSTVARLPRLSQCQWNQLSIEARNTWNLLDDADETIILSFPSFVNPNNNRQG